MKIKSPFLQGLSGLLAAKGIRAWMSTLDYQALLYDPAIDPASDEHDGQKIYVFWHENILFPLFLRGHCNMVMLLSQHGDADILARVAGHLGFECVRGSTSRGGIAALRELVRKSGRMNLTITPDGPRGPRRSFAPGSIYLASRLGLPLVAMGLAYERPGRMQSWDRFAVPKPGSRARAIVSPPLYLPRDLDRAGIEYYRQRAEHLLNRLTEEAQSWADSGCSRRGAIQVAQQAAPLPSLRPPCYGAGQKAGVASAAQNRKYAA